MGDDLALGEAEGADGGQRRGTAAWIESHHRLDRGHQVVVARRCPAGGRLNLREPGRQHGRKSDVSTDVGRGNRLVLGWCQCASVVCNNVPVSVLVVDGLSAGASENLDSDIG